MKTVSIKEKLTRDGEGYPFFHVTVVFLLAVAFLSIPTGFIFGGALGDETAETLAGYSVLRIAGAVALFTLCVLYGFGRILKNVCAGKGALIFLCALAVALFNFPFIGFFGQADALAKIKISALGFVIYIIYCLSVALFEELAFRGIIFPLLLKKLKGARFAVVLAALASSLLFGAAHLVGAFSGGIGGALFQAGYAFLIGGLLTATVIATGNIFAAVIIHFIYDFGGLFFTYVADGFQWDTLTVILTAVIGVIAAAIIIAYLLKADGEKTVEKLFGKRADGTESEEGLKEESK